MKKGIIEFIFLKYAFLYLSKLISKLWLIYSLVYIIKIIYFLFHHFKRKENLLLLIYIKSK